MEDITRFLSDLPFPVYLHGPSALDFYFRKDTGRFVHVLTPASLIEVAREFDNPVFPGCEFADVHVEVPVSGVQQTCGILFSCMDEDESVFDAGSASHGIDETMHTFCWDVQRRVFKDPRSVYPYLRSNLLPPFPARQPRDVVTAALLISRLGFSFPKEHWALFRQSLHAVGDMWPRYEMVPLFQRYLLCGVLEGCNPQGGLTVLKESGCIEYWWPELHQMIETAHAKEFHPEGDVWDHTLETLKYRKTKDLRISLALLLHDVGKPKSLRQDGNAFNQHAQIGASIAEKFLRRLGFETALIQDIRFLVYHHMLPSLLPQLPVFRTENVMSSPLFPLLLEVYRCDLSSTYRSPDDYYAACKVYRGFLRNRRNPYRSCEGKKLLRLYVEG
ncbi:MAG: HD domain-containing protein [Spirochaetales bacterium]|nr:HD domain-containing protein [Spirochaetales bacterium]